MVVPGQAVAPKSLPVRSSASLRMAKSMFMAFMLPSGLPRPETLAWRVFEHQVLEIVRFVNEEVVDAHLSEICNIIRRSFISVPAFQVWPQGFPFFFPALFIQPVTSLPSLSNTARFSSMLSISAYIFSAVFRGLGYFPELVVCRQMIQSQLLFLMSWNIPTRFSGVKSSLPGQHSGIRIGLLNVSAMSHIAPQVR